MSKVLIIDDDPDIVETMVSLLDDQGLQITTLDNAIKALALLATEKFDVIISDISMPQMSGLDFLTELRKIHTQTPVVFVSGHDLTAELKTALDVGHADFMSKPFDIELMIQKIQKLLQSGKSDSVIHDAA